LLVKDQEEIIEGLVYYLSHGWHKTEGNRWEIIIVDLGSKDQTKKILRCQIGCSGTSLNLLTFAGEDEERFLEGLTKGQGRKRIVVLALTGSAAGRKGCNRVGKVLAGDFKSSQNDLHLRD
jgi:hypothetical protein